MHLEPNVVISFIILLLAMPFGFGLVAGSNDSLPYEFACACDYLGVVCIFSIFSLLTFFLEINIPFVGMEHTIGFAATLLVSVASFAIATVLGYKVGKWRFA